MLLAQHRAAPGMFLQRVRLATLSLTLLIFLLPGVYAADGTWAVNADGNWSDPSKWSGGIVANGTDSTATFANGVGGRFVTLNSTRTIGNLTFGGSSSWYLVPSGG